MKVSFLLNAAAAFARLDSGRERDLLRLVARGPLSFAERPEALTDAGRLVELGVHPLDDQLKLAVCELAGSDERFVLALQPTFESMEVEDLADLVTHGSAGLSVGAFPLTYSPQRIAELVRRSLRLQGQTGMQREALPRNPITRRVLERGTSWSPTAARADFRKLMDLAEVEPQLVRRGDRNLVIIDSALLGQFEEPRSTPELADFFSRTPLPALSRQPQVRARTHKGALPELPDHSAGTATLHVFQD